MSNRNDIEDYPARWKTNKNLRWWLYCENYPDFASHPDDKFIHESIALDFAIQFNKDEIRELTNAIQSIKSIYFNMPTETKQDNRIEKIGEILKELPCLTYL